MSDVEPHLGEMPGYIDLARKFHLISEKELADPEYLASLNHSRFGAGWDWDEVLQAPRVIVLADGGSGKTEEFKAERDRRRSYGHTSFFLPIEQLKDNGIAVMLQSDELAAFERWKSDPNEHCYFFLDAVDELKLVQGTLDKALRLFARDIGTAASRATIVISSRPNDWDSVGDAETVQHHLPPPRPQKPLPTPDELFMSGVQHTRRDENSNEQDPQPLQVVSLLPLSETQVGKFAHHFDRHSASDLLDEIDRRDAWIFAQRPQDLLDIIGFWQANGRIGRRQEHLAENVDQKLREPKDRGDDDRLSPDKALIGAERLALALSLTQKRTLKDPVQKLDRARAGGVLDPGHILTDWTAAERKTLLRRPIFSIATYGRVRFHHRSVQEYLAARCLTRMLDSGFPLSAVFELLFADRYGERVILPSMKPIAAWLSLSNQKVFQETLSREPNLLLSAGDPESLPVETRSQILKSYFERQGDKGWNGVDISLESVKRIANEGLGSTVRDIWSSSPSNSDARELLANLIWSGPIESCLDIARALAYGPDEKPSARLLAVRAMRACGALDNDLKDAANNLRRRKKGWRARTATYLLPELFPNLISAQDLAKIVDDMTDLEFDQVHLDYSLRQSVDRFDPTAIRTKQFRDELAACILDRVDPEDPYETIHHRAAPLVEMLARLCGKTVEEGLSPADRDALHAMAVACRFEGDGYSYKDPQNTLRSHVAKDPKLREAAFWSDVALVQRLNPEDDEPRKLYVIRGSGLSPYLEQIDRPWLEGALAGERPRADKEIALEALMRLWMKREGDRSELKPYEALSAGHERLKALIADWTKPKRSASAEELLFEKHQKKRERISDLRECQRIKSLFDWRDEVVADLETAFSKGRRFNTMVTFYQWLTRAAGERRYAYWDDALVERAFGKEFTETIKTALLDDWRTVDVKLASEKAPEDRASTRYIDILGLIGLELEASSTGWARALTEQDTETATRLAMIELNGFSPIMADLAEAQPDTVGRILKSELVAQLEEKCGTDHVSILQDVLYGPSSIKKLVAQILFDLVAEWSAETENLSTLHSQTLKNALQILDDALTEDLRGQLAQYCLSAFEAGGEVVLNPLWMLGGYLFDPVKANEVLCSHFANPPDDDRGQGRIERLIASLFGHNSSLNLTRLDALETQPDLLGLVETVYARIRIEDDPPRPSSYSPTTRHDAEQARSELLTLFAGRRGYAVYDALLKLSDNPDCESFPDRLRQLARNRAESDCEVEPFSEKAAREILQSHTLKPETGDQLFRVLMSCLDEVLHDIEHHDFSDRALIKRAKNETELQRTLAMRLAPKSIDRFSLIREDEVAEAKRTDIRAHVPSGKKAVIEVKIAENWSGRELLEALEAQLVGQYLRHIDCRHGCLLLIARDPNRTWNINDLSRVTIQRVHEVLIRRADEIMRERIDEYSLEVRMMIL